MQATDNVSMMLPKKVLSSKQNDALRVTVAEDAGSKVVGRGLLTMRGTILRTDKTRDTASCGGFLFQFPSSYPLHTKVLITLETNCEARRQGKKRAGAAGATTEQKERVTRSRSRAS